MNRQVLSLTPDEAARGSTLIAERSLPASRGCVEWIGPTKRASNSSPPYGKLNMSIGGERRTLAAHRLAYMVECPLNSGDTVDHLCYNTLCVNPAHLEAVTLQENLARRRSPGRPPLRGADGLCARCGAEYISYEHASGKIYSRCPNGNRHWHAKLGKTA